MIRLKQLLVVTLLFLLTTGAFSQTNPTSSTKIPHTLLDSVEVKLFSTVMNVLWLGDTTQVQMMPNPLIIDSTVIAIYRKSFRDSTWGNDEQITRLKTALTTGAQNCYSYALQMYFEKHETFEQSLFDDLTHINREPAEKILDRYFEEVDELSTDSKQDLSGDLPEETLLAFMNKDGWASHFVYYHHGIFYSKNGSFAPIEFESLKKFLKKHYWDTKTIVLYRLDEEKVRNRVSQRRL